MELKEEELEGCAESFVASLPVTEAMWHCGEGKALRHQACCQDVFWGFEASKLCEAMDLEPRVKLQVNHVEKGTKAVHYGVAPQKIKGPSQSKGLVGLAKSTNKKMNPSDDAIRNQNPLTTGCLLERFIQ